MDFIFFIALMNYSDAVPLTLTCMQLKWVTSIDILAENKVEYIGLSLDFSGMENKYIVC